MDPLIQALLSAGVAGVVLALFVRGDLITRKACEERLADTNKQWSERFGEMRTDRNEWKKLALGTEKRLDSALPTVATAIGAPIPSVPAAPEGEAG